ncbi:MAG: polyketide cyclase [Thalassobius sp.]|nr:polyketide cyclase [Thalassovita sp.]
MQVLTVSKVKIKRPIAEVYHFVVNMENFGQWFPEVINIQSANAIEHGLVGKKYLETVKVPFQGEQQISLEVVAAKKNELFMTEGEFHPLLPRMTVNFSADFENNTNLTWRMESRSNNSLFNILLLPIFKAILKKRAKKGVQSLKGILEKES